MIKESILVVKNASHISESFDGAVPGSRGYGFSFGHINQIDNGVIMSRERFRLASIDNVEQINIVIP